MNWTVRRKECIKMEYAVYIEDGRGVYRLPVNPEEITVSVKADTQICRVLSGREISSSEGKSLAEISFEAEFPGTERTYTNKGFQNASVWENRLHGWMEQKAVVRLIAGGGAEDEINMSVFVTQVKETEKAGEEGDKYFSLNFVEYVEPQVRYVSVPKSGIKAADGINPAVTDGKTHTVLKGDTLWGIARKYYGNGGLYPKIYQANSGQIQNPNLIYPGQVLAIPEPV